MKGKELQMAITLINLSTYKFDINHYKDTYLDEKIKIIESKAKGTVNALPKFKVVHSRSRDLIKQLRPVWKLRRKGIVVFG